MTALHTAYVSSSGRDAYTFSCTCGARGGNWNSRPAAKAAAKRHEEGRTKNISGWGDVSASRPIKRR